MIVVAEPLGVLLQFARQALCLLLQVADHALQESPDIVGRLGRQKGGALADLRRRASIQPLLKHPVDVPFEDGCQTRLHVSPRFTLCSCWTG